jgi:hypothetical protein
MFFGEQGERGVLVLLGEKGIQILRGSIVVG